MRDCFALLAMTTFIITTLYCHCEESRSKGRRGNLDFAT
jgi:hypothetical protein